MIDKQLFYFSHHACPDNSVSLLSITERFNVKIKSMQDSVVFFVFFYRSTFVGSTWSFVFFIPGQWKPTSKDFYTRSYPLHYFLILILEKEPVFPFQCWVLNKGTTGTIFISSLVWRGPWLGIEPRTSRTQTQHSMTRLWRRRVQCSEIML